MLRVKTAQDVERLRREGALNSRYLEYLEELFGQLHGALSDGSQVEFSLESHGYIVVIERGDDPRNLSGVGLGAGGLLDAWPEFVEVVDCGDLRLYKVAVLYDNEYMMLFLSEVGQLDQEAEDWLKDQAEW